MTKMKKLLAVGLAGVLAVSFAACSSGGGEKENSGTSGEAKAGAKTGLAVVSQILNVEDTTLEIDSVAVAVLVDADGKVLNLQLDEAQTKPDLTKDKGNVSDLRTKLDKQGDYAMKAASPIQKEWFEQAEAFETWAKGKTADQITAGVDASGVPTDADLKAGCTINASNFVKAAVAAINGAKELGASSTDTLALNIDTEKYYESNDTNLQYDSNYAAVTMDASGKVTSCLIDASQAKCSIKDGKFTVKSGAYQTKKELGDAYNMKPASPIQKEWFEQADAIEKWAVGKTSSEIAKTYGKDMKTTDADLKAGCTITVNSIIDCLAGAATVK